MSNSAASPRLAICLVAALAVAGCATPTSSRYGGEEVGKPIETSRGTVVASRVVDVSGETTMAGPAAGAALGAAGMGIGVQSGWAALIGAVLGAGVGYATQQWANDREGIEYVVQLEDGRTVTLVQNRGDDEVPLQGGTSVLVQVSGSYTRVIAAPHLADRAPPATVAPGAGGAPATALPPASGGGWIDPDRPPAVGAPAAAGQAPAAAPSSGQGAALPLRAAAAPPASATGSWQRAAAGGDQGSWQVPPPGYQPRSQP